MKRLSLLAAGVFVLGVWMVPVNVGAQAEPATQNQAGQVVDKRVVPPYMSVRDKVMVQREIQQRAAASRNALKRKAWMEEQGLQKDAGKAPQQKTK
jgi:ABC-type nitrate/sulfonate/bicarbonate transport system ATPase subunit